MVCGRPVLLAPVAAVPDLTVRALRAKLIGWGTGVSYGAVREFLATEGLTYKKPCTLPNRSGRTWHKSAPAGGSSRRE